MNSLVRIFKSLCAVAFFAACSDYLTPVESTPKPTEFEYNRWLLQRTYLFEDELDDLPETGDSAQQLYRALKDPYTRYVEPTKSEAAQTAINTSMVPGDVGMTYIINDNATYPLFVYRVYPNGPAGRAGVPRYANIRTVNGIELSGPTAYATYMGVLDTSVTINITLALDSGELKFSLTKETVYAPTIFVDTLYGTIFITINGFKKNTADFEKGTYGELRSYLDSTQNIKEPRVLDLRGNPGGHVDQCVPMADLFVATGTLSSRTWRAFDPDGKPIYMNKKVDAKKGDPGENGKFIILADNHSASCAEIFAAAVTENVDIPLAGTTTYGKGIGQTNWNTAAGGLAIITNLEFLTPKGNSYHHKGLVPDYDCGGTSATSCVVEAIEKHFGTSSAKSAPKKAAAGEEVHPVGRNASPFDIGGAILQETDL
jgi:C-terminal peptidase prc